MQTQYQQQLIAALFLRIVRGAADKACVIAAARPDCRFVILGAGPMREEMLTLAAARGLGAVLMIRDVIEEPLVALAAFDVCLLTSIAEGTSHMALERSGSTLR